MCRPQVFEIDRRDETRRARERDLVATGPTDDGVLDPGDLGSCVQHVELVMAEGEKNNLMAVVLAEVEDGKVKRLDLCGAPSPYSARRTGEYPGRV